DDADLRLQLGQRLERGVHARDFGAPVGREGAILGFDERGDLLQQQDQRGGDAIEVVAGERASLRLDDRAVQCRQRGVVRRIGVARFAVGAVAVVVGRHATLSAVFDMSKRAIITGITGQDGSYLAELLLTKGYEVVGTVRRASAPNFWRIQHLLDRVTIKPADLLDQLSLIRLVDEVRPREFYNLAAMSFVPASWDQPMLTGEFNAQAVTRVLEA